MALPRPGLCTENVGQERLRRAVAVQDIVLAALLEVHHELHGDARMAGPLRMRRIAAVATEIPGIPAPHHLHFLEANLLRAIPEYGLAERRQILKTGRQRNEMIDGE